MLSEAFENTLVEGSRRDSLSTVTSSVGLRLIQDYAAQNAAQNNERHEERVYVQNFTNVYNNAVLRGALSDSDDYSRRGSLTNSEDSFFETLDWKQKILKLVKKRKYFFGTLVLCSVGTLAFYISFGFGENHFAENPILKNIIERDEWMRGKKRSLTLPIKRIIVAPTGDANETCFDFTECLKRVKHIQRQTDYLEDIAYNFLIGGEGSIFVGRGFKYEGEYVKKFDGSNYNDIGISVAFIGSFFEKSPTDVQVEAFLNFVKHYVSEGLIVENYLMFQQDNLHVDDSDLPFGYNLSRKSNYLMLALNDFGKFYFSKFLKYYLIVDLQCVSS